MRFENRSDTSCVPRMADGFVDTNVFIHALATDDHSIECRQFLSLIQRGELEVRLEATVMHELSYMLKRFQKQLSRQDVADYLLMILSWPGIQAEKILLIDAVRHWRRTDGLAFVDPIWPRPRFARVYRFTQRMCASFADRGRKYRTHCPRRNPLDVPAHLIVARMARHRRPIPPRVDQHQGNRRGDSDV
jgi:predicted nucleic acid-binding protein